MDENELLTKLAIGVAVGALIFGGAYLYRRRSKNNQHNKNFSMTSLSSDAKEKLIKYFENLKVEEKRYYINSFLNLYFDISSEQSSIKKSERVSSPYDLGFSFDDAQQAYEFIRDNLLSELNLKSDLSNSDTFIIAHDYFTYLGKKEGFEEASKNFDLLANHKEKFIGVKNQLEKELESLKQP